VIWQVVCKHCIKTTLYIGSLTAALCCCCICLHVNILSSFCIQLWLISVISIFRGFRSKGGQNFCFPIVLNDDNDDDDFAGHHYNSVAATTQPVIVQQIFETVSLLELFGL